MYGMYANKTGVFLDDFAYMDPMGIEAVYEAELAKVPREAGFFNKVGLQYRRGYVQCGYAMKIWYMLCVWRLPKS